MTTSTQAPSTIGKLNLLYIKVNPSVKSGIVKSKTEVDTSTISNLAIYDIEKDKLIHFFEKGSINNIIYYFYETSYNEEREKMMFNKDIPHITNNINIKQREKSDKLFVLNLVPDTEKYELWTSSRSGENIRMLHEFPKGLDWRIDIYNRKFIFIYRFPNEISVKAIDW